jgi:putative Mg2+ transporter-C (MgtC) family protein
VPIEAGGGTTDLARLVQGLAPGIGFLGAGAILKREEHRNVHGLTTAASIWLSAAIGFACGSGQIGVALLGTIFTYLILVMLRRIERSLPQLPDDQS